MNIKGVAHAGARPDIGEAVEDLRVFDSKEFTEALFEEG